MSKLRTYQVDHQAVSPQAARSQEKPCKKLRFSVTVRVWATFDARSMTAKTWRIGPWISSTG